MTYDTAWLNAALGLRPGQTAFPWQRLLLESFLAGDIPPSLDIPTGLGKTAVMALWLIARAAGANLPRRLVYVVDRRAVVDQATDVATTLRDVVDRFAGFKEALGIRPLSSLPVSTLRGQHVDNKEWLEDPSQPGIVVATVDMAGSRLLFQGYGVSRKMRAYHAGFLGADTLFVLDEAHLVPPFEALIREVVEHSSVATSPVVPKLRMLSLSATGTSTEGAFRLSPDDRKAGTETRKRLDAYKSLRFSMLPDVPKAERDKALAAALANEAWALTQDGTTRCIVFSSSRKVAELAHTNFNKLGRKADNVRFESDLFVGGRRVFERQAAHARLENLGFLAGNTSLRDHASIVFATSAAEVGVDLDADALVCDLVPWERMVQRLGRVNRRGDGRAPVIVVDLPEIEPPSHGREQRDATRRALARLPRLEDSGLNVSPGALDAFKAENVELLEQATTPAPLRPRLQSQTVDAWAMTSLRGHSGRPDVEHWLRGWVDSDPQTTVIWREFLPIRRDGGVAVPRELWATTREVDAFFDAAPPLQSEKLEADTFRVAEWLVACANAADGDVFGQGAVAFVLDRAGDCVTTKSERAGWSLSYLQGRKAKETKEIIKALIGRTLVVDARLGGLSNGLLQPKERSTPLTADASDPERWQMWNGQVPLKFRVRQHSATSTHDDSDSSWRPRAIFRESFVGDDLHTVLVVEKLKQDAATEDDRSIGRRQTLEEHSAWAVRHVTRICGALALPNEITHAFQIAARLHDQGKRAARWQRSIGATGEPLAKSEGRMNTHILDGYRHEFGSLAYAERDPELLDLPPMLRDLALHLIASHHGFARPTIRTNGCEEDPPSKLDARAAEVALRYAGLQRVWGPWGLAWLESILRAADHGASRENDEAAHG